MGARYAEELAQSVAEGFLEDIPKRIDLLKERLAAGDISAARRRAHSIKGASGNVGGEALRAMAFLIEQAGNAEDLNAARASVEELYTQFDRLKEAMVEGLGMEEPKG